MSSCQYPPGFSPVNPHPSSPVEEGEVCSSARISSGKAEQIRDGILARVSGAENEVLKIPDFRPCTSNNPVASESDCKVFSVYVDNIPEDVNNTWLESMFGVFGTLADVYIPVHKSKSSNKRYGFVRFKRREDADRAISNLDGHWAGRSQLTVQEALFCKGRRTPTSVGGIGVSGRGILVEGSFTTTGGSTGQPLSRWNGSGSKSFAQVVSGTDQVRAPAGKSSKNRKVCGVFSPNDWLDTCLIVKVSSLGNLASTINRVWSSVPGIKKVRKWGGRKIVLEFSSVSDRVAAMATEEWQAGLADIMPWDGSVVSRERCIWVSYSLLPISSWNRCTFIAIEKLWGTLIDVDERTASATDLSSAYLLIETEMQVINESINVFVGDRLYEVVVSEVSGNPVDGGSTFDLKESQVSRLPGDARKFVSSSVFLPFQGVSGNRNTLVHGESNGQRVGADNEETYFHVSDDLGQCVENCPIAVECKANTVMGPGNDKVVTPSNVGIFATKDAAHLEKVSCSASDDVSVHDLDSNEERAVDCLLGPSSCEGGITVSKPISKKDKSLGKVSSGKADHSKGGLMRSGFLLRSNLGFDVGPKRAKFGPLSSIILNNNGSRKVNKVSRAPDKSKSIDPIDNEILSTRIVGNIIGTCLDDLDDDYIRAIIQNEKADFRHAS